MPFAFPYDMAPDRASRALAALVLLAAVPFASSGAMAQERANPGAGSETRAAGTVPLPRPRPPRAAAPPSPGVSGPEVTKPETPPAAATVPGDVAAAPAAPSACRLSLTEAIAIAPSLPAISGPGACGGTDLVRLEAVVLADGGRVPLKPAATLRCEMAAAVAQWVRADIAPIAAKLGTELREIDNFDSYSCRGRNRVAGARISEHGKANAIDVRGFRVGDGRMLDLTDRTLSGETREAVKASVCARFTTVLGPGSDGYHEDHIHLDLAQRRSGYRLCQWNVLGPVPETVPLPPQRPAQTSAPAPEEQKKDKVEDKGRGKSEDESGEATPTSNPFVAAPSAKKQSPDRPLAERPSPGKPAVSSPSTKKRAPEKSSAAGPLRINPFVRQP